MAIRKILTEEDPVLQKKSHPVVTFDQKLWDLIDDLIETLKVANGLGLAAPQVGILRRVVIVMDDDGNYLELVNPKILSHSEESQIGLEGCLSVPGYWGDVERPLEVTIEAQDRNGKTFQLTDSQLVARCFCHEIDHLEGILYTTHCDEIYTADEIDDRERERKNK